MPEINIVQEGKNLFDVEIKILLIVGLKILLNLFVNVRAKL